MTDKEPNLTYGIHADTGQLLHIDQVPNGKRCECVCPGCRTPLVACHSPEQKIRNHFKHTPDENGETACDNRDSAAESIIHLYVKQFIATLSDAHLATYLHHFPTYRGHKLNPIPIEKGGAWAFQEVAVEKSIAGTDFVADILVQTDRGTLAIEVVHSNRVSGEKIASLRKLGINLLEVDVTQLTVEKLGSTPILQNLYSQQRTRWLNFVLYPKEQTKADEWETGQRAEIDKLPPKELQTSHTQATVNNKTSVLDTHKVLERLKSPFQEAVHDWFEHQINAIKALPISAKLATELQEHIRQANLIINELNYGVASVVDSNGKIPFITTDKHITKVVAQYRKRAAALLAEGYLAYWQSIDLDELIRAGWSHGNFPVSAASNSESSNNEMNLNVREYYYQQMRPALIKHLRDNLGSIDAVACNWGSLDYSFEFKGV